MKTTIEINDVLLKRAKAFGQREGVTLRTLVEQGLQQVLSQAQRRSGKPARIETMVFDGKAGFTDDFAHATWSEIKDESRRR